MDTNLIIKGSYLHNKDNLQIPFMGLNLKNHQRAYYYLASVRA